MSKKDKKETVAKVELTNVQADNLLQSPLFGELSKLEIPVLKMYLLKDVFNEISKALEVYRDNRKDIITKYADKNEDGEPVLDQQGNAMFTNVKDRQKALEDIREIGNIPLKVSPKKVELSISDLPAKMRIELGDFIDLFCEVKR
jgi:hypothetical protein